MQCVQDLLTKRCIRTAFHYKVIMELPAGGRHLICSHCTNWRRRSRRTLLAPRRTYTPFDAMLMFALMPGYAEEPDSRCILRLARTVLDASNSFMSVLPDPARVILSGMDPTNGGRVPSVLRGWWDANERTPFFRHAATSRVIRRMLSRPAVLNGG